LKLDTSQLVVEWQSAQEFELGMWFAGFPVALTPLWQEEQVPVIPV
jgi:hypothetical protein